ncbi:MAG: hypothetical protein QXJ74_05665 [Nitrososphaera sp.]
MSSTRNTESQIKQKVVNIIRTFRGIYVTDNDVRINDLKRSATKDYIIVGDYQYKATFGGLVIEKGTFDITLDSQNLEPLAYKIVPKV